MSGDVTPPRRPGITLAEVLIALAVLGTLAVIAVPSFIAYIRHSHTNEAAANVRSLFTAAAVYYADEHVTSYSSPPALACTVGSATTSNVPGVQKTMLDWSMESASFRAIGFTIGDPIYYQYAIVGSPDSRCDVAPGTRLYAFQARGDLDGDGTQSLYEVTAGSNERGELVRSAGIRIEREGE